MIPYADTNFLVRLFLDLPDSDEVLALADREARGGMALPVSWLHRLEVCNALQCYVFQRDPTRRRVTSEQAAVAWADFLEETRVPGRLRPKTISPTDLERQFEELSFRHTARHGFRTYDLIHVASALLLGCDTFWTFDMKAARLAALEGLKTQR